jgi:hypothetical protein
MDLPFPTSIFGQPVRYTPILQGINSRYEDIFVAPPIFVNADGQIVLSAEDNSRAYFADYYGEYAPKGYHGCPWVDPAITEWAADHGCFFEWRDPGSLILYRV